MLFKDAHASLPVFLFDRNTLSLETGKITSFSPSHMDLKAPAGKLVVDVTVLVGGKTQTYTIEDSLSIAYFGSTSISIDRDAILTEIENVKTNSEQILNNVDYHREVVDKCTQLLLDNNPSLKEKRQTEERFSALEGKMDNLMEMMQKFLN